MESEDKKVKYRIAAKGLYSLIEAGEEVTPEMWRDHMIYLEESLALSELAARSNDEVVTFLIDLIHKAKASNDYSILDNIDAYLEYSSEDK